MLDVKYRLRTFAEALKLHVSLSATARRFRLVGQGVIHMYTCFQNGTRRSMKPSAWIWRDLLSYRDAMQKAAKTQGLVRVVGTPTSARPRLNFHHVRGDYQRGTTGLSLVEYRRSFPTWNTLQLINKNFSP